MSVHTLRDGRVLALREPTPDDAAALIAFHKRAGGETEYLLSDENGIPGLTEESEREYLAHTLTMPNTRMLIGIVDGELVCLCDVRGEERPRIAHTGVVGIVVRQDFWHIGVGHILMNALTDYVRDNGVLNRMELYVRADNARAIQLYKDCGFTEFGCAHRYMCVHGAYYDMLQMEWLQ